MKRILSIVVVIVLTLFLFVGCGDVKDTTSTDTNSQVGDEFSVSIEDVTFVDANGESKYRIIRSENAASEITDCTVYLFKQIKLKLGISVKNLSDIEDGTDDYEILVGDTNRPESKKALDYLKTKTEGRYDDYIICSVGKKIVINGFNSASINKACKYFIENIFKTDGVKGGIEYLYATKGDFETITINGVNISEFVFVKPQYNTSYLTQSELDELQETLYKTTGYKLSIERDNDINSEYEIIIGNSKRDNVETVFDSDKFKILVNGKKVYLNGGSPHATAMAVSEFGKILTGDLTDRSVVGSYNHSINAYDLATTLYYVWGDDFSRAELDTEKWVQRDENTKSQGLNGKISVRSSNPQDVFISDGKFYICAREDEDYYYGGLITTMNKMCFRYGYAECSAVVPHGEGFWVAFWGTNAGLMSDRSDPLIPPLYTPEFDIMEMFGNSTYYAANLHANPTEYGKSSGLSHYSLDVPEYINAKKYFCPDGNTLNSDFHTYGVLWSDDNIGFTCDGVMYFNYDLSENKYNEDCFKRHINLVFSMATGFFNAPGSSITSNKNEWKDSNKLIGDYINLYQYNDGKCSLILGSTVNR
ncbi:MAG: glycoside hydrolase family 16 protein [Clostridia bacterium]|nr:glycoside hydrolase family 16 protein [Clostridia bacterium]MBO5912296.1 glycoside hydrolase family 16 protein [Clostridia bacterium]